MAYANTRAYEHGFLETDMEHLSTAVSLRSNYEHY
jgi:hypothetical protein